MGLIDLKRWGLLNVFSVILGLLTFLMMLFMPWPRLQPNKTLAGQKEDIFPLHKALLNFYDFLMRS